MLPKLIIGQGKEMIFLNTLWNNYFTNQAPAYLPSTAIGLFRKPEIKNKDEYQDEIEM